MERTLQHFENDTHCVLTAGKRMPPDDAAKTAIELLSDSTRKHMGQATRMYVTDNAAKLLSASIYKYQEHPISRASIAAEAFWSYRYDKAGSEDHILDIMCAATAYEYDTALDVERAVYLQLALSKCIAARAWATEHLPKECLGLTAGVDMLVPYPSKQTTKELLEQAYSAASFATALQPLTEAYHRYFEDRLLRGFYIAQAVDLALDKGLLRTSTSVEDLRLWMTNAIESAQRQEAPELLAQALVIAYWALEVGHK